MVQPIVPIKPLPKDATPEQRLQAFYEYCEAHRCRFPYHLLPPGVKKKWWQVFSKEHPFQDAKTLTPKYRKMYPQFA
jgi:hypothetical protein